MRTEAGDDVVPLLERADLDILGLLPRASNATFLAKASADGREALVVYKPRGGETPLWDFPEGTLCQREVAAFRVARALGWPRVPPTVLRDGPEGPGSVQLFFEFDPDEHYFTMAADRPDDFRRIALFDVAVNNADRKGGHCLLGADGIFVVDHGVCFHELPKLRTVIWDFAGEPLPEELTVDLERLRNGFVTGELADELSGLLSEQELRGLLERLEALLVVRRFPRPGPGRPYPWPVL